jgi:intergrase/recombinase
LVRSNNDIDQGIEQADQATNASSIKIDWNLYAQYLDSKYTKSYATLVLLYSKRCYSYLNDVKMIELVRESNRNNIIKSLSVLSKFLGLSNEFKAKMQSYGIKRTRQDAMTSFLRILRASDSDILDWYSNASKILRPNEELYLRFVKFTGLRKDEAIKSFNLIIELAKQSKLDEYYNRELSCLMHFKFKMFLRTTKLCYLSFISEPMLSEISCSSMVTYEAIRKRLHRSNLKIRINELRDYFGTYMVGHGLSRDEQDLLCGRIPMSIFIKHYWSPKLSEIGTRVFKAIETMP